MKVLSQTENDVLLLSVGQGIKCLEWYIYAAFGVHSDYKGHSRRVMKIQDGKGALMQKSIKQKLKTSSNTMCELVGVDDLLPKVLWMPLFLEEQGYKVE